MKLSLLLASSLMIALMGGYISESHAKDCSIKKTEPQASFEEVVYYSNRLPLKRLPERQNIATESTDAAAQDIEDEVRTTANSRSY